MSTVHKAGPTRLCRLSEIRVSGKVSARVSDKSADFVAACQIWSRSAENCGRAQGAEKQAVSLGTRFGLGFNLKAKMSVSVSVGRQSCKNNNSFGRCY